MSDETTNPRQPLTVLSPAPPVPPPAPPKPEEKPATEQSAAPLNDLQRKLLEGQVIKAIRQVYDPEIPVNIYELGLIYDIKVDESARVHVLMTLTAPGCPWPVPCQGMSSAASKPFPKFVPPP